ncbi:MAG: response regulator transcription factor [Solirubrobacterales bacterium]|nr:response regulator transcription factor [Solirubrobacterales bacterium]
MTARSPITVAIARFEDLLALGLRTLLQGDPSVDIVAADIAPGRLDVVLRAHRPRVLILDVGRLRDLAQVRELSVAHPQTRLVLLGQGLSSAESGQLLAFGASACLAKDTQARDVQNAIHLASRGLQLMPLGAQEPDGPPICDPLLTHREGDVLLLLRQGQSNAQIALALQVGVETVRTHARSIFRKLGVSSRRALIALPAPPPPPPIPSPGHPARPRSPSRNATRRRLHP